MGALALVHISLFIQMLGWNYLALKAFIGTTTHEGIPHA